MADYVYLESGAIQRRSDRACIPNDTRNKDYQELLAWQAKGNTIDPYVAPKIVPPIISDRQFFQQLANLGIITESDALQAMAAVIPTALLTLINQLPSNQQFGAKMLISGATEFRRNHPLTDVIGAAYGMTSDQIDDFFIAAAGL